MVRGLVVSPPDLAGSSSRATLALAPVAVTRTAPAPTLLAAPALSSSSSLSWRAVFGASAVRAVLEAWPGVRLSSFLRSPAHNAKVGGRPNSFHLSGLAGDFVVPSADRSRFIAWLRATFGAGVDIADEGDHIHVEWTDVTVTPLARMLLAAAAAIVAVAVLTR